MNDRRADEEKTSDGEGKKSFGKFSFSLPSKNTNSQPKQDFDCTKSSTTRTDPASLLASLKDVDKIPNKSGDSDETSESGDNSKIYKPIKMKLAPSLPKAAGVKRPVAETKKIDISDVFNSDEQADEEEMPPEAKMRMRNIGKDTPTASGPNSFNKGKLGFCNQTKMFERQLKLADEPSGKSKKKC